jgi:hypothetical protein
MAYAYATRSLSVSPLASLTPENPDYGEARHIISQLVPFLVERKAQTLFPTLSAAVTDIWSRFDPVSVSLRAHILINSINFAIG